MKKRSAPLEPPYTFFVDRCLGKGVVPQALREVLAEGEILEIHDDHYGPKTKDVEWLGEVGRRGWVVLSQDQNVQRNPLEQHALLSTNVAFFGLGRGDAPGPEKARSLASALNGVRRALRRFSPPIIATVTKGGDVLIKWADGERLEKAHKIAPTRKA